VRTQKRKEVREMELMLRLYEYLHLKELERRKRKPVIEEFEFLDILY